MSFEDEHGLGEKKGKSGAKKKDTDVRPERKFAEKRETPKKISRRTTSDGSMA